jgi:multiple sugar transport system ATP-binding protein
VADVKLTGVGKSFGDARILQDVNLDIRDGEFIVFVGPSGCGKSTLLRLIAGLEDITAGELRIGVRLVNDVPPAERGIAMVFQSYALYPHMNLYDNMAFGLQLNKMPKDEVDRLVQHAAKILGIQHLLDRKPKDLSGGQRQRVAIGRAIVRKPDVFLFDEPLSNLDTAAAITNTVKATADPIFLTRP